MTIIREEQFLRACVKLDERLPRKRKPQPAQATDRPTVAPVPRTDVPRPPGGLTWREVKVRFKSVPFTPDKEDLLFRRRLHADRRAVVLRSELHVSVASVAGGRLEFTIEARCERSEVIARQKVDYSDIPLFELSGKVYADGTCRVIRQSAVVALRSGVKLDAACADFFKRHPELLQPAKEVTP
jgi:hypothetical protein